MYVIYRTILFRIEFSTWIADANEERIASVTD
jgi:hypothetical protein